MTPPKADESSDSVVRLSTMSLGSLLWLLIIVLMIVVLTFFSRMGWPKQPEPNGGRPPVTSQENPGG